MATYKFSAPPAAITSGATTTFPASGTNSFTTSDFMFFDDETISASDAVITGTSSAQIVIGGKTFIFTSLAPNKISAANFTFADGSKLIIGDGSTSTSLDASANTLVGTDFDDYLDGQGGSDTVSYAAALSAVTVNLTTATAQNTVGAGTDKLLNIENIIGSAYNDTLTGVAAGSTINGGLGIDTLTGGAGNDTFIITAGDSVTGGGGTDTVQSSFDYALGNGSGLENLTLLTGASVGVGTATVNKLVGNSGNNVLIGLGDSGATDDTLEGGDGNDIYIITDGTETITETSSSTTQIDTVLSSGTVAALASNVENLRLMGSSAISGTGNSLTNIIYANSGSNATLDGGSGTDTLSYQFGATSGVTITLNATAAATGGSGTDASSGFENLTGSNYSDALTGDTSANTITGGLGNDTLDGGATAADKLDGGAGNDTYIVDSTTDTITDSAGTDTVKASVSFSIASLTTMENLTANGASGITLTGNSQANILDSESNAQTDTLVGGTGSDTYLVDSGSDTVTEDANGGTDTVIASLTYNLLDKADNVENLTLAGSGAITGTGNDLANIITASAAQADTLNGGTGNDKLVGNGAANKLDGGEGNDNMTGGAGDDTYIVDATGDSVVEASSGGTDTITASVSYTLGANLETLILDTGFTINGTGNSDANTLTGNNKNNTLTGGLGADTITGGDGKDKIVLTETTSSADHVVFADTYANNDSDTITGFSSGTDILDLNAATAETDVTLVTGSLTNTDDLVYFLDGQASGSADSLSASATAINAAATWTTASVVTNIIVVDDNSTAIYEWTEAGTDGAVASELKLMGIIDAVTASTDYLFI